MFTDLFLENADHLRSNVWQTIKAHPEIIFEIITKRVERIEACLPEDWGDGYENVIFCVSVENQRRADERIPLLQKIPAKHKWITCSPLLEEINIQKYLDEGFIEHVECCGEKGD
jgi:protein gp37